MATRPPSGRRTRKALRPVLLCFVQGACKQTSGSHSGTCKHLKLHRDKPRFTGETYRPASTGPSPSERFSTPIVPRPPTVGSCGQAHQPLKELDVSTAPTVFNFAPSLTLCVLDYEDNLWFPTTDIEKMFNLSNIHKRVMRSME